MHPRAPGTGRGWFRAGGFVEVRVARPVGDEHMVTCVIPGHGRTGREVSAERLEVHDGELDFSFRGNCGYESDFDCRGCGTTSRSRPLGTKGR